MSAPPTTTGTNFYEIKTSNGNKCLMPNGTASSWADANQHYLRFGECGTAASVWRLDPFNPAVGGVQNGGALFSPTQNCYIGWADNEPSRGTDNRLGCWPTPTPPLLQGTDMSTPQYIVWQPSYNNTTRTLGSSGFAVSGGGPVPQFNQYALADYYNRGEQASLVTPTSPGNAGGISAVTTNPIGIGKSSCSIATGHCYPDPEGKFQTYEACAKSCQNPNPPVNPSSTQWWIWVLVAVLVFLLVMGAVWYVNRGRSSPTSPALGVE